MKYNSTLLLWLFNSQLLNIIEGITSVIPFTRKDWGLGGRGFRLLFVLKKCKLFTKPNRTQQTQCLHDHERQGSRIWHGGGQQGGKTSDTECLPHPDHTGGQLSNIKTGLVTHNWPHLRSLSDNIHAHTSADTRAGGGSISLASNTWWLRDITFSEEQSWGTMSRGGETEAELREASGV